MISLLIILALVLLLCILVSQPKRTRRRARQAQARIWQEAEARGDITILDDRGSDRPTVDMKRRVQYGILISPCSVCYEGCSVEKETANDRRTVTAR